MQIPTILQICRCVFFGLSGKPDVLERKEGKSDLGSYHYVVKDKLVLESDISIQRIFTTAFYNLLVGSIQGYVPPVFYISDASGNDVEYSFLTYVAQLEDLFKNIRDILNGKMPAPIFDTCPYPWKNYCNKLALKKT